MLYLPVKEPNDMTHEWVRAIMAITGALSVFLGYRLFCDSSHQKPPRLSIFLVHMAAGALLALFGLGILIADARDIRTAARYSHSNWQKSSAKRSFETPKSEKAARLPDSIRLI